jgi:hypothetical protein
MKRTVTLTGKELENLLKRKLYEQEEMGGTPINELASRLIHSQTQSHIFHLQTGSYAEHKALQGYYENIDDLMDSLVESYQGENDIIKNYRSLPMNNYDSKEQVIGYFEDLMGMVRELSEDFPSYLKNIVDEIEVLINSTLYKLKRLS